MAAPSRNSTQSPVVGQRAESWRKRPEGLTICWPASVQTTKPVAVGDDDPCRSQVGVGDLTGEMLAPLTGFEIHWYSPLARETTSREGPVACRGDYVRDAGSVNS